MQQHSSNFMRCAAERKKKGNLTTIEEADNYRRADNCDLGLVLKKGLMGEGSKVR